MPVTFSISAQNFQTPDVQTGDLVVYPGVYTLAFDDGTGQSDSVLTTEVELIGAKEIVEKFPEVS